MRDKAPAVVVAVLFASMLTGCSGGGAAFKPTATITPTSADLITGGSVQFATNISTSTTALTWSVNGSAGGNASVGTIDGTGFYTAPASQPQAPVTVTVASATQMSTSASATVTVIGTGTVATTANPQVAQYTIAPSVAATVSVEFGTDTSYGFSTSTQNATGNATPLPVLVAGMKSSTTYHMRAVLKMPDGSQLFDNDHTFASGIYPHNSIAPIAVSNPNSLTPQAGVEMLDLIGNYAPVVVSDLSGNVLWSYTPAAVTPADLVQPIKLLPNGHFVLVISPVSSAPLSATPPPVGTIDVVREIDLAGTTIREISIDTLNTRLVTAGFTYTAQVFHHDIAILPNGHWIVMVNSIQQFTNLPGIPGTTNVLGDALVDLDTDLNPVWMWNTFDHLDINRHPMVFPDWTHANAVLYSPTDGNLLMSMRHQNWIIKIDYEDGKGAGDILWHLGEGGEFALQGGTDPTDWFYAQHGPSFATPSTAGTFSLAVFDDGNDRMYPSGQICTPTATQTCPYSTAQVLNIDETNKTAAFAFHQIAPTYSVFGGNNEVLANQNVEYDLASVAGAPAPGAAAVYEVTPSSSPETVWQMSITNASAYRAFRMPSLYPGVQW